MLVLLDTASLYYRSYYALPESMTAPDGFPNNMLRGFLSTLARIAERFSPDELVACWDDDWRPQWRVDELPSYKTHRVLEDGEEETPDTLSPQITALRHILDAAGIPRLGARHYEADDIIATLAAASDEPVVVVTGDRDMVQLITDRTSVLLTVNGGMEKWPLLDPAGALERFGVPSHLYVDFASMRGDSSDGIPGVPGIGPKTAAALICAYGDLESVLAAAESDSPTKPLTPRIAGLLREYADQARAARRVSVAATDAPVLNAPRTIPSAPANSKALSALLAEWGLERQFTDAAKSLGLGIA